MADFFCVALKPDLRLMPIWLSSVLNSACAGAARGWRAPAAEAWQSQISALCSAGGKGAHLGEREPQQVAAHAGEPQQLDVPDLQCAEEAHGISTRSLHRTPSPLLARPPAQQRRRNLPFCRSC